VASRTADEYRDQCKSLNERVEGLTCESDRLSKEIKRLEANTEMKSNDYLKLEVSQMSLVVPAERKRQSFVSG